MKKAIVITLSSICVVAALAILANIVIIPMYKRNEAIKEHGEKVVVWFESLEAGDEVTLGRYEQDNDKSNGTEELEWIVLEAKDDRVLLISKYVIDGEYFDDDGLDTWDASSLRSHLNNSFLEETFTDEEQDLITRTELEAEWGDKVRSKETKDKIFLLSIEEVDNYFPTKSSRQCQGTKYAKSCVTFDEPSGACRWWLRTPGYDIGRAAFVYTTGGISDGGYPVDEGTTYYLHEEINGSINLGGERRGDYLGVRPAMWISIYD